MQGFSKILVAGITWRLIYYISTFLLNILITNALGASESGSFFYIINNLAFAIQLLCLGQDVSLSYSNSKNQFGHSYLFSIVVNWSVIVSCIFSVAVFALFKLDFIRYDHNILLLLLFVLGTLFQSLITALFISGNNSVIPNLIPSIINVLLAIYLFSLLSSGNKDVLGQFLEAFFFGGLLAGVLLILFFIYSLKPKYDISVWWPHNSLINYGLKVFAFNLCVSLLLRSDIWVVKYFANDHDLGNYIQAGKMVQLIILIPNLASFVLLSLLTQKNSKEEQIKESISKLCNIYFYISLCFSLFFVLTGYWIFPMIFGRTFDKMYQLFVLLIPGILCFSTAYPIDSYFSSIDKNKVNIKAALYALLLMFILDIILIPSLSIYGAAIGSSIAYVFFFWWLKRQFSITFQEKRVQMFSLKLFIDSGMHFIKNYTK